MGERRLLLIIGDVVASIGATLGALLLWSNLDWLGFSWEFVRDRASWFIWLPLLWMFLLLHLYDMRRAGSWTETIRGILLSGSIGVVLYLAVYFSSEPGALPRRGILYFLILAVILTLLWRRIYLWVFTAPQFMRRTLIVGAGFGGQDFIKVLHEFQPPPFYTVGLIDDDEQKQGQEIGGAKVLGTSRELISIVQSEAVTDIIVAIQGEMNGRMFQTLLDAQERGVQITRMPVAYEELMGRVPINHLASDWVLRSFVDEVQASTLYTGVKRMLDIVGGLFGLTIFALIYPWVALATLIESGRPVLFFQGRLGRGGREFGLVKFRTMGQDAEADGIPHWAEAEDPRITRVGKILRKTHLDEFPQFWNVLVGDMSLVGPRPERPELVLDLEKQIPFYRARLLVKPGITGWAQVNYGKGASIQGSAEKLEYDLYYIKHRSLIMDLNSILRTLGSIIGLQGV